MQRISTLVLMGSVVVGACSGGDMDAQVLPYSANLTAIIGGGAQSGGAKGMARYRLVDTPDGDDCVDEGASECLKPQLECGDDGATDMLVDAHGKPLVTLCYPTSGVDVEPIDVAGDLAHVGNNTVLVLDELDDDADVAGDLTIDGNNVTVYGHGPDVSLIGGDLHVVKNNARIRGVRVLGNVVIDKNNASLVDCVIEGDLTIHGNNAAVALCEVWGEVSVIGNNTWLVEDRFASPPALLGHNTACSGNLSFEDANADGVLTEDEWLVDEPVCPDDE